MANTDFFQWNPPQSNQEPDSIYAGDSLRVGGLTLDAIFASAVGNKAFYQWSTMVAALAWMLVEKGYTPVDGSSPFTATGTPSTAVINLATVLANILTNADIPNMFTNPTFTGVGGNTGINIQGEFPSVFLHGTEAGSVLAQILETSGFLKINGPSGAVLSLNLSNGSFTLLGGLEVTGVTPTFVLNGTEGSAIPAYISENAGKLDLGKLVSGVYTALLVLNLSSGVISRDGTNPALGVTPSPGDASQNIATMAALAANMSGLFNDAGTRITSPHIVSGFNTVGSGGTVTVTFTGAAVFASNPIVVATGTGSANPVGITSVSTTDFSVQGTALNNFYWIAIGN